MARSPPRPHIGPVRCQPAEASRSGGGMQIVDHMLPFMPLSLFVSALSLSRSGAQSKVDKVLGETKGAAASYPQFDAYCSEQLWKCQTGLR